MQELEKIALLPHGPKSYIKDGGMRSLIDGYFAKKTKPRGFLPTSFMIDTLGAARLELFASTCTGAALSTRAILEKGRLVRFYGGPEFNSKRAMELIKPRDGDTLGVLLTRVCATSSFGSDVPIPDQEKAVDSIYNALKYINACWRYGEVDVDNMYNIWVLEEHARLNNEDLKPHVSTTLFAPVDNDFVAAKIRRYLEDSDFELIEGMNLDDLVDSLPEADRSYVQEYVLFVRHQGAFALSSHVDVISACYKIGLDWKPVADQLLETTKKLTAHVFWNKPPTKQQVVKAAVKAMKPKAHNVKRRRTK
jgi:hypothetical protein